MLYEAQSELTELRLYALPCSVYLQAPDGYKERKLLFIFKFLFHITFQENELRQSVFGRPIWSWSHNQAPRQTK